MALPDDNIDILETLDSTAEKDVPEVFLKKLISIFEHSKEEIVEFLKAKSMIILKSLRDQVFAEMVIKLPQYAGRELYARRKGDMLAEDIYVFAFSAVNSLPDKRLTKCLKPVLDLDATHLSSDDDVTDAPNIQNIVELCIQLQDKVNKLEKTVKSQNDRIAILEGNATNAQMNTLGRLDNKSRRGARDQAEGGVAEQPATGAEPGPQAAPSQPGDAPSDKTQINKVVQERVAIGEAQRKPTQNPGPQGAPPQQAVNPNPGGEAVEDGGFRHTTQERRNIQRGQHRLRAAATDQADVQGTSTENHRISAAPQSGRHLVYVGKLSPNTTNALIRQHLHDNNITDIADVVCLTNRFPSSEVSFCVSLDNEASMNKMFESNMWPLGVVIRPFRPSRPRRSNYRGTQNGRSWQQRGPRHPRLQDYDNDGPKGNNNNHWSNRNSMYGQAPRFGVGGRRY
jgi:hypothetical protein